jgi:hypothetical protein
LTNPDVDYLDGVEEVAFTATTAQVSILLPVGMVPIAEYPHSTTYGELVDETDDPLVAHRTVTIRRWYTDSPHRPSAETVAELALHDSPLSHDWTGPTTTTTVDGTTATSRPFRDHDGIVGTVTACDLIDTVVTVRSTWHPDDRTGSTRMPRVASSARFLALSDLAVDRASLYHPVIGISLNIPLGWHIPTAERHVITLANDTTTVTFTRVDTSDAIPAHERITIATASPLHLVAAADNAASPTEIAASDRSPEQLLINAHGITDATRGDTMGLIASLRTHPR